MSTLTPARNLVLFLLTFALVTPALAEDWEDLREDYSEIRRYLEAKGRITAADRASLDEFQARIDAFRSENEKDPRPIAMELEIAFWLGDSERVDANYEALARLSDSDRLQVRWARHCLARNQYDDVMAILQRSPIDYLDHPEAALLLAKCHMARNRFQEAIDTVALIPERGLFVQGVRPEVNRIRDVAGRWLELWPQEQTLRAAEEAAGTLPVMQLITARGPVTILLYEEQAPNTVANFIELAEKDFYDGTRFHRVEKNFVVQGGDPNSRPGSVGTAGTGGRGSWIPDESDRPDKRFHFSGSVAMAKSPDPAKAGSTIKNSGSSQFYVVLEPMENLNEEYTVFGRVIDGIEVIEGMQRDDELIDVVTISRPERTYVAETLPVPGIPPAGTPVPEMLREQAEEEAAAASDDQATGEAGAETGATSAP